MMQTYIKKKHILCKFSEICQLKNNSISYIQTTLGFFFLPRPLSPTTRQRPPANPAHMEPA